MKKLTFTIIMLLFGMLAQAQSIGVESLGEQERQPYENTIKGLVNGLKSNDMKQVEVCFTPEGWEMFRRWTSYGEIGVNDDTLELCYLRVGESVECLGMPISIDVHQGTKSVEHLSFVFGPDAKIHRFALGLDQKTALGILGKECFSLPSRLAIINLLEAYKTAYALKQIEFINDVLEGDEFGGVLANRALWDMYPFLLFHNEEAGKKTSSDKIVVYSKNEKAEYLHRLMRCFNRNEYVETGFEDVSVIKMASGGELYGIQAKVNYYSKSFGDTGYLSLLVDLNNPDQIQIKYCVWQKEIDEESRFSLMDLY